VFRLTVVTYLLVWAYIGVTWFVASRLWRGDRYRGLGRGILMLHVAAVLWVSWALVHPGRHGPNYDYMYESIGCLLACLSGLLAIVWCTKSFGPGPLMAIGGSGWLLMIYATLIAAV
jgi:hypothetical protein